LFLYRGRQRTHFALNPLQGEDHFFGLRSDVAGDFDESLASIVVGIEVVPYSGEDAV